MNKIEEFQGNFRWASNFWRCDIEYKGVLNSRPVYYPTVEHGYQAQKALTIADQNLVRNANTPGGAKRFAQKIAIRPDWEKVKYQIMEDLVMLKFDPVKNKELHDKLLATGTAEMIEGNNWGDIYWGVCKGKGQNNLGKILMYVRGFYKGQAMVDSLVQTR